MSIEGTDKAASNRVARAARAAEALLAPHVVPENDPRPHDETEPNEDARWRIGGDRAAEQALEAVLAITGAPAGLVLVWNRPRGRYIPRAVLNVTDADLRWCSHQPLALSANDRSDGWSVVHTLDGTRAQCMLLEGPRGPSGAVWLLWNGADETLRSPAEQDAVWDPVRLILRALEARLWMSETRGEAETLRKTAGDLSLLVRVMTAMTGTLDPDAILSVVLTAATAGSAIGFNRALAFMLDDEENVLQGVLAVGPASSEEAEKIWSTLSEDVSFESLLAMAAAPDRDDALNEAVRRVTLPCVSGANVIADAILDQRSLVVQDAATDRRVPRTLLENYPARSFVVVPVVGEGRKLGALVADNAFSGRPIQQGDVDLLEGLAGQAALALENALMYTEVMHRLRELGTVQEVGKNILTTTELDEQLRLVAYTSARAMEAEGSALWLIEESEQGLDVVVRAAWGAVSPQSGQAPTVPASVDPLAERAMATGQPARSADDASEPRAVAVPLVAQGHVIGSLAVWGTPRRAWTLVWRPGHHEEQFLSILADQAAIAIENARLFSEVRSTEKRLREVQAHLLQSEKLAALGEMSAKMAHEIRNPLASIGGFARRVAKDLSRDDPNREYLEIVTREAERLERILTEQLQFARFARPRLAPHDLNTLVQASLVLVHDKVATKQVRVLKKLEPALPPLLLDADKINQVLLNILHNALESVPVGERIQVVTACDGGEVLLNVANDGPSIAREALKTIFLPFATSRAGGTGLGLAVAWQIVREHGGSIAVDSNEDWSTIFTVRLPIPQPSEGTPAE
jgi:signal transduction histidine kinase